MKPIKLIPMAVLLLLFGFAAAPVLAQSQRPIVIDGDTVAVYENGKRIRVRAVDYDAPDVNRWAGCPAEHAKGVKAARRLNSLLNLRGARIEDTGQVDQYGRRLAYYRIGKTSIGSILIREGHALPHVDSNPWRARLCGVAQ